MTGKTWLRAPRVTTPSESESPETAGTPRQESSPDIGQQESNQLPLPNLIYPQPDHDARTDDVPVEVGREKVIPTTEIHPSHSGPPVQSPQFAPTENLPQSAPPPLPYPVAPSPVPRRSGRRQTQMPARYGDFYTGQQFDQATTEINFMDSSCNCYQMESQVPPNPQEEIVGLYRIPLPPSQWNLIAWWNGCAWEWTQVA